jgi:hypothetical protein
MRRVLRNYLISFLIIGLLALVVWLIDQWANERASRNLPVTPPSAAAPALVAPVPRDSTAPAAPAGSAPSGPAPANAPAGR